MLIPFQAETGIVDQERKTLLGQKTQYFFQSNPCQLWELQALMSPLRFLENGGLIESNFPESQGPSCHEK